MGWHFQLKHANNVAYLTVSGRNIRPPRMSSWDIKEFLGAIQGEYSEKPPLISHNREWIDTIISLASKASNKIRRFDNDEGFLSSEIIEEIFSELKEVFCNFNLYGMPVGIWDDKEELDHFAKHAAYSSRHHGLFLIPEYPDREQSIDILDPFPEIKIILQNPDNWPGVLFWGRHGSSVFLPIHEAYRFYQHLLGVCRP